MPIRPGEPHKYASKEEQDARLEFLLARVRVFGSMARGDAGPHSDVDLLVEVRPDPSPWFPGRLVAELEELLGRRVQIVTERGLDELLRDRVNRGQFVATRVVTVLAN